MSDLVPFPPPPPFLGCHGAGCCRTCCGQECSDNARQCRTSPHTPIYTHTHTRAHALSQTINKPTLYTVYQLHRLRRSIPGPAAAGWPCDFETHHLFIQTGGNSYVILPPFTQKLPHKMLSATCSFAANCISPRGLATQCWKTLTRLVPRNCSAFFSR